MNVNRKEGIGRKGKFTKSTYLIMNSRKRFCFDNCIHNNENTAMKLLIAYQTNCKFMDLKTKSLIFF